MTKNMKLMSETIKVVCIIAPLELKDKNFYPKSYFFIKQSVPGACFLGGAVFIDFLCDFCSISGALEP